MDRLQRGVGAEHAAAARAEHIPLHLEETETGCMQKRGDDLLGIEAVLRREGKRIDAREIAVGAVRDHASMAATAAGSAVRRRTENWDSTSPMARLYANAGRPA